MFKRNIEVSRRKKVENGMERDLEKVKISEKLNNREKEPHVGQMNLDIIMNCSRAYLIANAKNK